MRPFLSIVLTVWLILLAGQPAQADKRVALVIGNSSYRNVAKLSNPANDAGQLRRCSNRPVSTRSNPN